jgi:hypothetical protein
VWFEKGGYPFAMTEKGARDPPRSEHPHSTVGPEVVGGDLKEKRDAFLHTFFKRGAELTEELVGENRRLHDRLEALEQENTSLRTQLASDKAIRDLLRTIDELEREKARLLSTVHSQAEMTDRFAEVESELESFANLYVASFQLHISLHLRTAVRHVREMLIQLVGARSLGIYFVDDAERHLLPIVADGIDLASLPMIPLREGTAADPSVAIVERTYLTGVPHVTDGEPVSPPAACIPLQLDERIVGAIVVYTLLEHKKRFVTVDRELFKLLGAHAGSALLSAYLWGQTNGRWPGAAALRELSG